MKLYLIFSNYFDGCDNWKNLESIHTTYEEAEVEHACLITEERTSFYIEQWETA